MCQEQFVFSQVKMKERENKPLKNAKCQVMIFFSLNTLSC